MSNKLDFIKALYDTDTEIVKFSKMYDDVIIPTKRKSDAGFDIYARLSEDFLVIEPHKTVLIPTGLRVWVPEGHYMQLFERGSTGVLGIGQRAGVIDSGYMGEIKVPITNHNENTLILTSRELTAKEMNPDNVWESPILYSVGKAITQGIILPVPEFESKEITEEEMLARNTERGEGRLGSSKK
jgi:dUTP pyrophosphatase